MGFPAKLTEEEQALMTKYEAFKKKKKSGNIQKLQNTTLNSVDTNKHVSASVPNKVEPAKENVVKEPMKPKDAKEKAKQLLASGQLKINQDTGVRSFKRARSSTNERKPKPPSITEAALNAKSQQQAKKIENIKRDSYNKFVTSSDRSDDGPNQNQNSQRRSFDGRPGQKKLYISGYGLTKHIVDNEFGRFGTIRSKYYDPDKSVGYITFDASESAEKAIDELHGSQVEGVILKVGYARKRPYNPDDNRYTTRPTSVRPDGKGERYFTDNRTHNSDAARLSDESPTKKRKLVTYTEPDEFDF